MKNNKIVCKKNSKFNSISKTHSNKNYLRRKKRRLNVPNLIRIPLERKKLLFKKKNEKNPCFYNSIFSDDKFHNNKFELFINNLIIKKLKENFFQKTKNLINYYEMCNTRFKEYILNEGLKSDIYIEINFLNSINIIFKKDDNCNLDDNNYEIYKKIFYNIILRDLNGFIQLKDRINKNVKNKDINYENIDYIENK